MLYNDMYENGGVVYPLAEKFKENWFCPKGVITSKNLMILLIIIKVRRGEYS